MKSSSCRQQGRKNGPASEVDVRFLKVPPNLQNFQKIFLAFPPKKSRWNSPGLPPNLAQNFHDVLKILLRRALVFGTTLRLWRERPPSVECAPTVAGGETGAQGSGKNHAAAALYMGAGHCTILYYTNTITNTDTITNTVTITISVTILY